MQVQVLSRAPINLDLAPSYPGWLGHADGGALLLKTYGHYMPEHARSNEGEAECLVRGGDPQGTTLIGLQWRNQAGSNPLK